MRSLTQQLSASGDLLEGPTGGRGIHTGHSPLRLLTRRREPQHPRAVRITVNGTEQELPNGLTVAALLLHLGFDQGPVAVERNRSVLPRAQHASEALTEGDILEIVHFVGGG